MNSNYALDTLLRPAVELYTVMVCTAGAFLCIFAPWALALTPLFGLVTAAMFLTLAVIRCRQALRVLRYRGHIRRLTAYSMASKEIPISNERLFMARGFAGVSSIPSAWSALTCLSTRLTSRRLNGRTVHAGSRHAWSSRLSR